MKPSIGRIVIYHLMENSPENVELCQQNGNPHELPAVIVRVWSDNLVNLKVLTDGPYDIWVTSVQYGHEPRHWSWPVMTASARVNEPTPAVVETVRAMAAAA